MTFQDWCNQQPETMAELGVRLRLHATTMSRLYQGRHWPSADTARRIYQASGGVVNSWSVDYLQPPRTRSKRQGEAHETEAA